MYCKYCAELLPDKAVKCGKCGADIDIYDGGQSFFEEETLADWDKELVVEEPAKEPDKASADVQDNNGGMPLGLTARKLVIMVLCDIAAIAIISFGIKTLVLDKAFVADTGDSEVSDSQEIAEQFEETTAIDENSPVFPANGKFVVKTTDKGESVSECQVPAVLINGNRFYSLLHVVSCLEEKAHEENFSVTFENENGDECSFEFDGKEFTYTKKQNRNKVKVTAFRYDNAVYVSENSLSELMELLEKPFEIKREYSLEECGFELEDGLGESIVLNDGIKLDKNSTLNEKFIPVRAVLEKYGYEEHDGVFNCKKEWKAEYRDGFVVFFADSQRQIKLEAFEQADGKIYISEYEISSFADALKKNDPELLLTLVNKN